MFNSQELLAIADAAEQYPKGYGKYWGVIMAGDNPVVGDVCIRNNPDDPNYRP